MRVFLAKSNDCNLNVYLYAKAYLKNCNDIDEVVEWDKNDPRAYSKCNIMVVVPGENSMNHDLSLTVGRGIHDFVKNFWNTSTVIGASNVLFLHHIVKTEDFEIVPLLSAPTHITLKGDDWKNYAIIKLNDLACRLDTIFDCIGEVNAPKDIIGWTAYRNKKSIPTEISPHWGWDSDSKKEDPENKQENQEDRPFDELLLL